MNHPDFLTWADYWLGESDDDAIEEHLLACGECARTLEWVARFAKGVRAVVQRGNLGWVLTPAFLARLEAEGLRVRTYLPLNGGGVECTITRQDDLLMGRLRADLRKIERLDIVLRAGDGTLRDRLENVAFPATADAELVLNQPVDEARAMGKDTLVVQLVAVERGGERVVGEYTFNHSRTVE